MLRVSDTHTDPETPHFMTVDKKKRQVTLTDPAAASNLAACSSQERGPMVAAPKMFAFDNLFTAEDQQVRPDVLMYLGQFVTGTPVRRRFV